MLKILPYNNINFCSKIKKRDYSNISSDFNKTPSHENLNFTAGYSKINKGFTTISQAQEYFLNNYGINMQLEDLSQANLLKQALIIFDNASYQKKDNKIFEGLEISPAKLNEKMYAINQYHFSCIDKNDIEKIEKFNIDPNSDDVIDFMGKYLIFEGQGIYFNQNAKISQKQIQQEYDSNYHSVNSQVGYLIHELVHWLHYNNSPKQAFWTNEKEPSEEELKIMKSVSRYASMNFDEFIAEYASGRLTGEKYPLEAYELYKKLNAPDLFS